MIYFTLTRTSFLKSGIFGLLECDEPGFQCFTLEHAYDANTSNIGAYWPKIPMGAYLCRRGMHKLEHMDHEFETFEITGVTGHTNILFHIGNYNRDSSGCVLLGDSRHDGLIADSKSAFDEFMRVLEGTDQFQLQVI